MIIRNAQPSDIPDLARIHHRALPDDFLPSLGQDFLEAVYYPAALLSQYGRTLVIEQDSSVAGFVTVAHESDLFSQDVLRNQWHMIARYAIRAALRKPFHVLKSAEVLGSVLFSTPDPVKGEIVFIALAPEFQGQGLGRMLVTAALEYLKSQGYTECRTKTLTTNIHVIRMYEKMGWQVRNRMRLIGREYVIVTYRSTSP